MATAKKLNKIAAGSNQGSYINFDSLTVGKLYKVLRFGEFKSEMFNKERNCVRVDIEEGSLILPERFDKALSRILKMSTKNLYIVFKGRDKKNVETVY